MRKPTLVLLTLCMLGLAAFLPAAHAQTLVTSIPLGTQNLNEGALGPPVFDPSNGNVYVSALGTTDMGTVSIISGSTNTVTSILDLSTSQYRALPGVGLLDPSNGDVYVPDGPVIHVISGTTNQIVQNISGMDFSGVSSLAFDTSNGMMYAPNLVQSSLSVIDTTSGSVVATVHLPSGAGDPVFDSVNGDVYVPGFNATTVVSAASDTLAATIPFSSGTSSLAVDPSTGSVLAIGSGRLVVISSSNQVAANETSGGAGYAVFDPTNSDFYLLTSTSGVEVFSAATNKVIGNMNLNFDQENGTAAGLAIDSANGDVLATFAVPGVVLNNEPITATFGDLISGTAILGQVQVANSSATEGDGGGSAVFDSTNGDFYVPNIDGTVSVVNPQVVSVQSPTTSAATSSSSSALPGSYLLLVVATSASMVVGYIGGVGRRRR